MSQAELPKNPDPQTQPLDMAAFPWTNEDGLIMRAPTAEEGREWSDFIAPPGAVEPVSSQEASVNVPAFSQRTIASLGIGALAKFGLGRQKVESVSVLGSKKLGTDYVAQPSIDGEFGYGNQKERFSALKRLSFDNLKNRLVTLNRKVRDQGVDDAKGHDGITIEGRMAGGDYSIPHSYPDARDVEDVLHYALDQAKAAADIQDAAMILAGGTVAAHPFAEGNGRVSRAIYSEISMGLHPDTPGYDLATKSSKLAREDFGGSAMFNMGSGFLTTDPQMKEVHRDIIYQRSGLERTDLIPAGYMISFRDAQKKKHDTFSELYNSDGLGVDSVGWLNVMYDNFQGFKYDRTARVGNIGEDESLRFALSYAEKMIPKRMDQYKFILDMSNTTIGVDRIFASNDPELLGALAEGTRQYYKQYAMAYIDMLGSKSGTQINNPHGTGTMSLGDRIVELTNNALAEKLTSKSAPLGQKLQVKR